jgi:hypothetical protein
MRTSFPPEGRAGAVTATSASISTSTHASLIQNTKNTFGEPVLPPRLWSPRVAVASHPHGGFRWQLLDEVHPRIQG